MSLKIERVFIETEHALSIQQKLVWVLHLDNEINCTQL